MAENKNKRTGAMLGTEMVCMLLVSAGIAGLSLTGLVKLERAHMVGIIIFVVLGIAIVGFGLRRSLLTKDLEYDNEEHPGRFWLCFLIALFIAFVCVFLPKAAWPVLPVYIMLSLFGSLHLGILGATVLLTIPVSLSGAGMEVFLLYMISGFMGAVLFRRMKSGFHIGLPLVLSLGGLLVCETAGCVLVENIRPGVEYFVIPTVNLVVSGIMILGIMKFFFGKVIYKYREEYLDLNDPENPLFGELKQMDRNAYMKSVHTAYFCEQIALKLGMDAEALKCAGYYHDKVHMAKEKMEHSIFPPMAQMILDEYQKKDEPVTRKETAVLIVSEKIVSTMMVLLGKSETGALDYDKIIDAVFKRYQDAGTFKACDITIKEFYAMQKIFKEEKLYYDFLR